MICTRAIEDCLVNSIDNEIRRYDIEMLLAGMCSFVKYGKADILEDYFTIHKVKDPAILNLMRAWNILFWNESPKTVISSRILITFSLSHTEEHL